LQKRFFIWEVSSFGKVDIFARVWPKIYSKATKGYWFPPDGFKEGGSPNGLGRDFFLPPYFPAELFKLPRPSAVVLVKAFPFRGGWKGSTFPLIGWGILLEGEAPIWENPFWSKTAIFQRQKRVNFPFQFTYPPI